MKVPNTGEPQVVGYLYYTGLTAPITYLLRGLSPQANYTD
jgi:hypothetical protein